MKTMKTKNIVNELYAAIKNGMSYEEAAGHAMVSIKDERGRLGGQATDLSDSMDSCMKEIIALLVEKNDHSIRFEAEEGQDYECDESWDLSCRPYIPAAARSPWTELFAWNQAEEEAINDAATLSQFVLDFYGIKEHAERKLTKKETKDQIKFIKREIASKTKEIKALTSKMNKMIS